MNYETKKYLKDKTRHAYGLVDVLKWDVDTLREDANNQDIDKLRESIRDIDLVIQKLSGVIEEIHYILKLGKTEGP